MRTQHGQFNTVYSPSRFKSDNSTMRLIANTCNQAIDDKINRGEP